MTADGVTRSQTTSKERIDWFKLGLDPPSMQRDKDSRARKHPGAKRLPVIHPSSNNRAFTPQKLTIDYLRA